MPGIFCRGWTQSMTELLQASISLVTFGATHEFGMADAVKFPVRFPVSFAGLVKSPGLVVGPADHGQRRKYRGLVLAVPSAPAGRQCRRRIRHRAYALALCGLCFRLRIQVVPSARG